MKRNKFLFVKAWRAPRDVLSLMKKKCKGRVLNLCCGDSLIGDVNVDLKPQYPQVIKADILADDFDLKEQFDTVVADPPWNWDYVRRHKFNKVVGKHLKDGGLFILNAPWLPKYKYDILEIYIPFVNGGFQSNITAITIAQKRIKK